MILLRTFYPFFAFTDIIMIVVYSGSGLPPEIAYFRIPHVGWNMNGTDSPRDWYVKGTG